MKKESMDILMKIDIKKAVSLRFINYITFY